MHCILIKSLVLLTYVETSIQMQSYDSICEYLAGDFLTYSLGLTSYILVEKQKLFYFFSKEYLIRIDNPYNYFL